MMRAEVAIDLKHSAAAVGSYRRHADFVRWYLQYLTSKADPKTGLWCTDEQRQKRGLINCIGGSFHIDFVFQFVSLRHRKRSATYFGNCGFLGGSFGGSLGISSNCSFFAVSISTLSCSNSLQP